MVPGKVQPPLHGKAFWKDRTLFKQHSPSSSIMCYPLQRNTSRHKAKTHNVPTSEALYSAHITGYQAATSFPRTVEPLEPEMFLQLTSMKQAWTPSRNKWFLFPMPEEEETDSTYLKYMRRPAADRAMSFLQWLCHYSENPAQPKRYKGATLW